MEKSFVEGYIKYIGDPASIKFVTPSLFISLENALDYIAQQQPLTYIAFFVSVRFLLSHCTSLHCSVIIYRHIATLGDKVSVDLNNEEYTK